MMQIGAAARSDTAGNGEARTSPPPPPMTPTQQGDLAAGRLHVAEGQVFAGLSPDAPPTRAWGDQPAGSAYRIAFDSAATRIGSRDPEAVGAALDAQLYGARAPATTEAAAIATPRQPAANDAPSAQPQAKAGEEGVGSFLEGAVLGNFSDNHSWSATGGQVVVGFIPIVGQIADARDTVASIGQVIRGEEGGWLNLGASIVGWVPGVGDAAKAAIRGGGHLAEAGADIAKTAVRHGDEIAEAGVRIEKGAAEGETAVAKTEKAVSEPPKPSANGVPGTTIAQTAERTGLPEMKIREILDTPKPARPDPTTYLSSEQIAAHLKPFEETGAVKFTPRTSFDRYDTLGPPDGGFVISHGEFETLIEKTGGDVGRIEDALQLRPGDLSGGGTMISYIKPEHLSGLRVPSGREAGAWDGLWVPGGFTGKGVPEAVIDLPAGTRYTEIKLGGGQ